MKTKLSKTDWLQLGLAGILTLATGAIWGLRPTLANRLLEEFPTEITGAKEIKKYKLWDADKTLVHIRQKHAAADIENMTGSEIRQVVYVQGNIYEILEELTSQYGGDVFYEGNWKENHDLEYGNGMPDLEHVFRSREHNLLYGAELLLFNEGKISLIPAETYEGYTLPKVARDSGEVDFSLTFDRRENEVLEIVSESQYPINIVTFGGAHFFGDNILEWNKQNPDKRYSLIEITPESYDEKFE